MKLKYSHEVFQKRVDVKKKLIPCIILLDKLIGAQLDEIFLPYMESEISLQC
jgi:hypothetical protein